MDIKLLPKFSDEKVLRLIQAAARHAKPLQPEADNPLDNPMLDARMYHVTLQLRLQVGKVSQTLSADSNRSTVQAHI